MVVDFDLHVSAEDAGGDGIDAEVAEGLSEVIAERRSVVGFAGAGEAWSATFAGVGEEGELADDQHAAGDVEQGAIELAFVVVEDAEIGDLVSHAIGEGFGVVVGDAGEQDEAVGDGLVVGVVGAIRCFAVQRIRLGVCGDGCLGDALEEDSHG